MQAAKEKMGIAPEEGVAEGAARKTGGQLGGRGGWAAAALRCTDGMRAHTASS